MQDNTVARLQSTRVKLLSPPSIKVDVMCCVRVSRQSKYSLRNTHENGPWVMSIYLCIILIILVFRQSPRKFILIWKSICKEPVLSPSFLSLARSRISISTWTDELASSRKVLRHIVTVKTFYRVRTIN